MKKSELQDLVRSWRARAAETARCTNPDPVRADELLTECADALETIVGTPPVTAKVSWEVRTTGILAWARNHGKPFRAKDVPLELLSSRVAASPMLNEMARRGMLRNIGDWNRVWVVNDV